MIYLTLGGIFGSNARILANTTGTRFVSKDDVLNTTGIILVHYYALWSGRCTDHVPAYDESVVGWKGVVCTGVLA